MEQWIVPLSAAVYWGGVSLRALQLRRRLGRLPNLTPRGAKENWLWIGWALVVCGWALGPSLTDRYGSVALFRLFSPLATPVSALAGLGLVGLGMLGTAWCHAGLGNAWRVGVRSDEKTPLVTLGPYRWLRHPIYSFQIWILAGVLLLWPTPLAVGVLALHRLLIHIKILDEEKHLERLHGPLYKEYAGRTGSLWPKV